MSNQTNRIHIRLIHGFQPRLFGKTLARLFPSRYLAVLCYRTDPITHTTYTIFGKHQTALHPSRFYIIPFAMLPPELREMIAGWLIVNRIPKKKHGPIPVYVESSIFHSTLEKTKKQ